MTDDKRNITFGAGGTQNYNEGTQHIYQQALTKDFNGGLEALKARLYAKAVQRFEDYLTTVERLPPDDPEPPGQRAQALFYLAIALLNGSAPQYRELGEIDRILSCLDQAVLVGSGLAVERQAHALSAIVKEDYYLADGMQAPDPQPRDVWHCVYELDARDLEPLVAYLAPVDPSRSPTWTALANKAHHEGLLAAPPSTEPAQRVADPSRPEQVRRYFTPTPLAMSGRTPLVMIGVGLALIPLGIAIGTWFFTLLFLAGGGFLAIRGWQGWLDYREYLRQLALAEPKPSDLQMDQWLADDIEQAERRAADRLRLDVRTRVGGGGLLAPPQVIVGIPSRDQSPGRRARVRYGRDGRLRSNRYDVLIVYLATNLIATYECMIDFHIGQIVVDMTREHQYRHVVGVSSGNVPMPDGLADAVELVSTTDGWAGQDRSRAALAQVFTLSIASGEQFSMLTGYGPVQQPNGKVAWPNDSSLAVIQRMVRTRTGGF